MFIQQDLNQTDPESFIREQLSLPSDTTITKQIRQQFINEYIKPDNTVNGLWEMSQDMTIGTSAQIQSQPFDPLIIQPEQQPQQGEGIGVLQELENALRERSSSSTPDTEEVRELQPHLYGEFQNLSIQENENEKKIQKLIKKQTKIFQVLSTKTLTQEKSVELLTEMKWTDQLWKKYGLPISTTKTITSN